MSVLVFQWYLDKPKYAFSLTVTSRDSFKKTSRGKGLVEDQFSSVTQSCLTLCNPMNRSTPGLPVHHQLPESTPCPLSWWCHIPISSSVIPFSSCPQSFPASGGQSIGVSASASVLPMNIQDWFSLALTGLISMQSMGLSTVFSNTTAQKHQFFSAQPGGQKWYKPKE